jgi:hypothetical protein
MDNWKNITNFQNSVWKKVLEEHSVFTNCHIIGLDTVGLVFVVSGNAHRWLDSKDVTSDATLAQEDSHLLAILPKKICSGIRKKNPDPGQKML